MFVLFDDFNKKVISRHRTVETAAKAKAKFFREFYRNNTRSSYLPIELMVEYDGEIVPADDDDILRLDYLEFCG